MSRLSDLSVDIPRSLGPATKGYGHKVWNTRRANQFMRDVEVLTRKAASELPALQLAAHAVSEVIVEKLPAPVTHLPRFYAVLLNSQGERALSGRDGVLLNPGYSEALPGELTITQFAHDLRTGFLAEIDELLKAAER